MNILGLDIGSSSVKAAILRGAQVVGRISRQSFPTSYDGLRAEVDPNQILRAIQKSIQLLGVAVRRVDAVALSVMAPAWVAMNKHGRAITPMITHQDRRSVDVAIDLERRIGKARHLKLVGNRPTPGGISSTTWSWFNRHEKSLMKRADLVGHLNTFLLMQFTNARLVDPSNASFMGLFHIDQSGWCEEICEAVGASEHQLPQIVSGDAVGGMVTHPAASKFGLAHGTPVLAGLIDTGSAMLLAGANKGQLLNVCGSTDVLALCVGHAKPHEHLITRALGVDNKWLSVSTLAAGGSTFQWMRERFFADFADAKFTALLKQLARKPQPSSVRFEPYLAGDRMSLEQRYAALSGLTLSTTREQILSAAIEAIASASANRVDLLRKVNGTLGRRVMLSGGVVGGLGDVLHRDWPGKWTFRVEQEASLRGLGTLPG